MSDLKISELFKAESNHTEKNLTAHCLKCTVVINGGKIQIPILRGVRPNKISVFLDILTVHKLTYETANKKDDFGCF